MNVDMMNPELVVCLSVATAIVGLVFQIVILIAIWRAMKAHESLADSAKQAIRSLHALLDEMRLQRTK